MNESSPLTEFEKLLNSGSELMLNDGSKTDVKYMGDTRPYAGIFPYVFIDGIDGSLIRVSRDGVCDCPGYVTISTKPKSSPYSKQNSKCLQKAADDEPIFVLLARDKLAARTVRQWAQYACEGMTQPGPKIDDALACADAMDAWRSKQPK